MTEERELFTVDAEILQVSGGAALLRIAGHSPKWVPKSMIRDWSDEAFPEQSTKTVSIQKWFLVGQGWRFNDDGSLRCPGFK